MNATEPRRNSRMRTTETQVTRSAPRASSPARMVRTALAAVALLGAACTDAPATGSSQMAARTRPARAPQPRGWLDGLAWVNHAPITAPDLAGKVTVVEFWTFGCINCRRSVPGVKRLEAAYAEADDVVLVGVHTPEFDHERDAARVAAEVRALGLGIAVAQDNGFAAWRAFGNRYWPAFYVLDREGAVRHVHIGELHFGTPRWDALVDAIDAAREENS